MIVLVVEEEVISSTGGSSRSISRSSSTSSSVVVVVVVVIVLVVVVVKVATSNNPAGWKGMLFFIIEQVPPQAHIRKGQTCSDWQAWVEDLLQRAPMWRVQKFHENSMNWGLPQHRERIYTVALNKNFVSQYLMPPQPLMPADPGGNWSSILHPGIPHIQEEALTPQKCLNLQIAKSTISGSQK